MTAGHLLGGWLDFLPVFKSMYVRLICHSKFALFCFYCRLSCLSVFFYDGLETCTGWIGPGASRPCMDGCSSFQQDNALCHKAKNALEEF